MSSIRSRSRILRGTYVIPSVAALIAGCTASVGDGSPAATGTQAIAWGANDTGTDATDQLKRDVVVQLLGSVPIDSAGHISGCSGTLVTPRIVITASHCLRGDSVSGDSFQDNTPNVFVGERGRNGGGPRVQAYNALPYINRQVNVDRLYEAATDVAILYLPVSQAVADSAIIERPSLYSPDHGGGGIAGFAPENLDSQGNRQVGWVPFQHNNVNDARYHSTYGAALRPGDSGGPLFVVRADGSRDLIGVNSQTTTSPVDPTGHTSYDADITSDLMANWIRAGVQDAARGNNWYGAHGVTKGNYWIGEVDYTGPCRSGDADCDHWNDNHDNCPAIPNIDQNDADDDGFGDACPGYHAKAQNDRFWHDASGNVLHQGSTGNVNEVFAASGAVAAASTIASYSYPSSGQTAWFLDKESPAHLRQVYVPASGQPQPSDWGPAPPGCTWSGSPAVSSWGEGRADLYVNAFCSGQLHLFHETWENGNTYKWNDISPPGTQIASSPAAVSMSVDRLDVVVTNSNLGIVHGSCSGACDGAAFTWDAPSPRMMQGNQAPWNYWSGDPALASPAPGVLRVFSVDLRGDIDFSDWSATSPTWTPSAGWYAPQTKCFTGPSVTTSGENNLFVACTNRGEQLFGGWGDRSLNGTWWYMASGVVGGSGLSAH